MSAVDAATNPNKRFKISDIQKNKLVDLTLSDSEDSDDDIVIVGSREVNLPTRPLEKKITKSPVNLLEVNNNNHVLPPNLLANGFKSDKPKNPFDSLKLKSENNAFVKNEISKDSLFKLTVPMISTNKADLVNGYYPVVTSGKKLYSSLDVSKFGDQLLKDYNKSKDKLNASNQKSLSITTQVQTLNQRKERLKRFGTNENDFTLKEIIHSLRKLSDESRALHTEIKNNNIHLAKDKENYILFENKLKSKILNLLKSRPNPPPRPVPQHLQQPVPQIPEFARFPALRNLTLPIVSQADSLRRINIIGQLLTNNNNLSQILRSKLLLLKRFFEGKVTSSDVARNIFGFDVDNLDDEDDYDDDDNGDDVDTMEALLFHRNNMAMARNALNGNIYTNSGEDNSNLKELLASIKKVEEEKEGEAQTPELLTVNLLAHQRLGLHWLMLAEDDKAKQGGILADDMGLGKTVQLISLILAHRAPKEDKNRTNLIVCPVALMHQWKAELEMKVKEEAGLKIFIFHSVKQKLSFEELNKYDVVITSFTTLANEYKKHIHGIVPDEEKKIAHDIVDINKKKAKVAVTYNSPFFTSDVKFYRTILDEVQWIKNKATNASLAVTGINSHFRWCLSGTPMQNKVDELFPYLRFLRIKPYDKEMRFRVDITIPLKSKHYDDYDQDKAMGKVRVILKAIMLRREKNSMIDGKPILQLPEKTIKLEKLDITLNKNEASFYYSMEKSSADKVRAILNGPKAKGNYSNILALLLRLRQAAIHSELVRIGERKQGIIYDEEGKISHDPKKVVRLMCYAATQFKENVINRINEMDNSEDGNRFKCPICFDSPPDDDWTFFSPCGHGVCNECVDSFFEQRADADVDPSNEITVAKCSDCRLVVKKENLVSYEIFDRICNRKQTMEMVEMIKEKELKETLANGPKQELQLDKKLAISPKIEKAIELINTILEKNPNDKIIIFSQFTTFFSIFTPVLQENGIDPLLYVGSMNANDRTEVIKQFYRDDNSKVLLLSMKAGNVGLTLTCANHVIIMDPFWNPYVEEQAQDRAYRIGQFKPVTVYRILVRDSVEDRIMELQDKKKKLIESAMDENGRNFASGLNRKEIGLLFGINDL